MVLVPAMAFWLLNSLVPRFADDYCRYAEAFSVPAITTAVADDYQSWTGRVPVMLVNRTVFSLGDTGIMLFDCVNAIMLALTLLLVIRRAHLKPVHVFASLSLLGFLLWFSPHRTGEFLLWKTGAIQYFWGCVIAAWVIKPQLDAVVWDKPLNWHPLRTAAYVGLALAGGAWLENLSAAVAAVWLLLLVQVIRQGKKNLPAPMTLGLAGWLAGTALLVAAPGNYQRAGTIGFIDAWPTRLMGTAELMLKNISLEVMACGLVLILLLMISNNRQTLPGRLSVAGYYLLIGGLSVLALVAAPEPTWVGRVVFPFEFFLILALVQLFDPATLSTGKVQRAVVFACVLLSITTAASFGHTLMTYNRLSAQEAQRGEILAMARSAGATGPVMLPPLYFSDGLTTANGSVNQGAWFARDITPLPSHWRNACYARAHGVRAVVLSVP